MNSKKCLICNKEFYVKPSIIKNNGGMYCSKACYHKSRIGKPSWNKGIHFISSGSFKKGYIPWCAGTKGIVKAWNKGKKRPPFSEKWKRNMSLAKMGNKSSFKGGITKSSKGYILVKVYNHPFASKRGYIMQSRLVMEKKIGHYLIPEEVVHHKGTKYPIDSIENRQDNREENLQLFANDIKHRKFHKFLRLGDVKVNLYRK